MSLRGRRQVGVYLGSRSRRGEWEPIKMSSKNFETAKRRKLQERRSESEEEGSVASHDSSVIVEHCEETNAPLGSLKGFYSRAKRMAVQDWIRECRALADQVEENTRKVEESIPEEFCARCGEAAPGVTALVATLLAKTKCALQEYSRRHLLALSDLNSERGDKARMALRGKEQEDRLEKLIEKNQELEKEAEELAARSIDRKERLQRRIERIKVMETERQQLRAALEKEEEKTVKISGEWEEKWRRLVEEKSEIETERDQLRAALSAREEAGRGEAPSARNDEPEEVEMGEESSPSPTGETIVPAILTALEGWFEEKWNRMVSHGSPSIVEGREVQATDNRSSSWAEAVGREEAFHNWSGESPPGEKRRARPAAPDCF